MSVSTPFPTETSVTTFRQVTSIHIICFPPCWKGFEIVNFLICQEHQISTSGRWYKLVKINTLWEYKSPLRFGHFSYCSETKLNLPLSAGFKWIQLNSVYSSLKETGLDLNCKGLVLKSFLKYIQCMHLLYFLYGRHKWLFWKSNFRKIQETNMPLR